MKANALVIGKDQSLTRVFAKHLRNLGFSVLTAKNKDDIEGLILTMSLTLCVVFGLQSGVEVIEMVRKLSPETKIIAASGSGASKEPMTKAGANEFLLQVFKMDELSAMIRDLKIRIPNDPDPSL